MGDQLKFATNYLLNKLKAKQNEKFSLNRKKFLVMHWTPSEIIDTNIKYEMITMPRCEKFESRSHTLCKYEMTSVLKYFSKEVKLSRENKDAQDIIFALERIFLDKELIKFMLDDYNNITDIAPENFQGFLHRTVQVLKRGDNKSELYNKIACDWMKLKVNGKHVWKEWVRPNERQKIHIGGIFPISVGSATGHVGELHFKE